MSEKLFHLKNRHTGKYLGTTKDMRYLGQYESNNVDEAKTSFTQDEIDNILIWGYEQV